LLATTSLLLAVYKSFLLLRFLVRSIKKEADPAAREEKMVFLIVSKKLKDDLIFLPKDSTSGVLEGQERKIKCRFNFYFKFY
jgi:hypothetical protein